MQFFFSLPMAALLPPASTLAQDPESWNAHPGYNMDRGPAAFHGLRLHWES